MALMVQNKISLRHLAHIDNIHKTDTQSLSRTKVPGGEKLAAVLFMIIPLFPWTPSDSSQNDAPREGHT